MSNHFTRGKAMPGNIKDVQAVNWDTTFPYMYSIPGGPQSVLAKEMFTFLGITVTEAALHDAACLAFKTLRTSVHKMPSNIDLLMLRNISEAQRQAAIAANPAPPKPLRRKDTVRTQAFQSVAEELSQKVATVVLKPVRTTDLASSGDLS